MKRLLNTANEEIFDYWSNILKVKTPSQIEEGVDIFDYFLKNTTKINEYIFDNNSCIVILEGKNITIYSAPRNEYVINKYKLIEQTKWQMEISKFHLIISNFPLPDIFLNTKICLRYEIIVNYFSCNKTHYFNKNFYTYNDDYSIFIKKTFTNALLDTSTKFIKLIHFTSFMLNKYDLGLKDGNDNYIKQKINISSYGRWYSNKSDYNIQLNKDKKEHFINTYIKNDYNVYILDMFSAEPFMLYSLSKIQSILDLIELRSNTNNENESLFLKSFLNIYIHSKMKYINIINYLKQQINIDFDIKIYIPFIEDLDDKMNIFNNKILNKYNKNLACLEGNRRIVNPFIPFINNKEAIKEHRKFHCAHVIDAILGLALDIYEKTDIIPVYLLHDEIMYACKEESNENFEEILIKNINAQKKPIKIEKIERN